MKILILLSLSFTLFASSIEGEITYKEKSAEGVLFVFAKKYNSNMRMPLAVKRIANPKFPLKFKLSAENAMVEGMGFEGPFEITARLTKDGNAFDRSGPQGLLKGPIAIGSKDLKIEIK